jgi:hypothetical protein
MTQGELWHRMHAQPRRAAASLTRKGIPKGPGVYAWYRKGKPVYSGSGTGADGGLQERIWDEHLKTGNDLSRSTFRRSVCEDLCIAPRSKTKLRPTLMTAADIEPVNRWIRECEVAWIECQSAAEAKALEDALHAEWKPPLCRS